MFGNTLGRAQGAGLVALWDFPELSIRFECHIMDCMHVWSQLLGAWGHCQSREFPDERGGGSGESYQDGRRLPELTGMGDTNDGDAWACPCSLWNLSPKLKPLGKSRGGFDSFGLKFAVAEFEWMRMNFIAYGLREVRPVKVDNTDLDGCCRWMHEWPVRVTASS